MDSEQPDYTVKFGHIARTLEYHDSQQDLRFAFDIASAKSKNLVLEHHARSTPRVERYSIAFERTKKYLESCGYQVDIYGE